MISSKAPTARGVPGLRVDSETKREPVSSPSYATMSARRDPGETLPTTCWPTRWTLSRTSIASSCNRIDGISTQAFADEEVVKETTRDNPLRNGVIREATLRKVADLGLVFQCASATSLLWGASLEVGNVAIQIRFICFKDSGYIGRCKVVKQILD